MTPLDTLSLKGYLETNSGLENTWPRLETRLTSRAIEKQDLLRYSIQISRLDVRLILLDAKEDVTRDTEFTSHYSERINFILIQSYNIKTI